MSTYYRGTESGPKTSPRLERIDFDRALEDPSYGNAVFDIILGTIDLPETKKFVDDNKDKLKKIYSIVFNWRPKGEPVLLPDGNIISGHKFAGQDAYDLLKMAELLEVNISDDEKEKLLVIVDDDEFLNEKFKKEAGLL